ncbi:Ferritin-like protein [Gracilaria domingensis]|nr:Ferritin-like protein [Gracilaria domingensis]
MQPHPHARPKLPRLNFSGRFFCDVSTVNNDVRHFDVNNFRPNYQIPEDESNTNGQWNPEGTGTFSLTNCNVVSVHTLQPATDTSRSTSGEVLLGDPLSGAQISGNTVTVQGKMVDLDPQMQFISQLFGVRVTIKAPNANISPDNISGDVLSGEILPCAFRDMWTSLPSREGFPKLSAVYQGVIKLDAFSCQSSQFLRECEPYINSSKQDKRFPFGAMSIRFRVANFDSSRSSDNFRYGDVNGLIQPWLLGQPDTFDAARVMRPIGDMDVGPAYFSLQKSGNNYSVSVDLCNSLVRVEPDRYKDIGSLLLCILVGGYHANARPTLQLLGEVPYLSFEFHQLSSSVAEISVSESLALEISNNPLGIVAELEGVQTVLFAEANDGLFAKADQTFMRLNKGDEMPCNIFVAAFGSRQRQGYPVLVGLDSSGMKFPRSPLPGIPLDGIILNTNTPTSPDFTTTVYTNEKGVACLKICAGEIHKPRKYLDGQVYGVRYSATSLLPPQDPSKKASDNVNVLVFDEFVAPPNPSWIGDILPIFKQYANLYPSMGRVVRLDDYGSVLSRRKALWGCFTVPETSARYMPVSRNLSAAKREMIVNWLGDPYSQEEKEKTPLFMNTKSKSDLMDALQIAIELEHATIPPYLTALYSIKRGYNQYIADAIREVVQDEMAHMTMACNILISIGGRPNINKMGFVPKYPGPLPGGLRNGLLLRLRKLCLEQVKAFMDLEAPEQQLLTQYGTANGTAANPQRASHVQTNDFTIGFVYDQIIEALTNLHETGHIQFPDDVGQDLEQENLKFQVVNHFTPKVSQIRNLEDAVNAIEKIKDEGEGASPTNPTDCDVDPETGLLELSHFFKFSEIVNGRRIVLHDDETQQGFSYSGPKIEIDEDGVYNMQDDPNVKFLPKGSRARLRSEAFSRHYRALLNALHISFNGNPDYIDQAVSLMFQLTIFAEPLMQMPVLGLNDDGRVPEDGTTVGISFQMPFDEREDDM